MAKNAKAPLTPEQAEIKAMKKTRRSERTLKFFAVLLALILTVGTVYGGKSAAEKKQPDVSTEGTNTDNSGTDDELDNLFGDDGSASGDNTQTPGDNSSNTQTPGDNSSNTQTPGDNSGNSGNNNTQTPGNATAQLSRADAVKLLNEATAKAVDAGYDWNREGKFTQNINVGSLTNLVNTFIKGFAKDADLDSVVGGFLGIGNKSGKHTKGDKVIKTEDGGEHDAKFSLMATKLTEADLANYKQSGDVYVFQVKDCITPYKDGTNAISRTTNDFVAPDEVQTALDNETKGAAKLNVDKSQVKYASIIVKATIKDNTLEKFELSYKMDVSVNLSLGFSVTGTGKATISAVYSNFVY